MKSLTRGGRALVVGAVVALLCTPASAQRRPRGGGGGTSTTPPPAGDTTPNNDKTEDISLSVGESRPIPNYSEWKSFTEPLGGVADVRTDASNSQATIVGLKAGSTSFVVTKRDGTTVTWSVGVFSQAPGAVEHELEQLLDGITGLRVRRVGSRFFIEGGVSSESDLKKIEQVVKLYPGQVVSLVGLGSAAADRKFNIRVDFYFVQYSKTSSYALGLHWPSAITGAVNTEVDYEFLSKTTTGAAATITAQALPSLDIAAANGWAKVLKQSAVITTNGTEALFQSGGEANYPITAGLTAAVKSFEFGTNVTVTPRYDSTRRDVEVKVVADVADLAPPLIAGTSLPSRNTSKLSTVVHMKLGQSLILSGIRTLAQTRDSIGLPLLSEIPILGVLFGSQQGTKSDIEGAIFIIPSVVEAAPRGALDMVKSAMTQYENYSGNIQSVNSFSKLPSVPDQ